MAAGYLSFRNWLRWMTCVYCTNHVSCPSPRSASGDWHASNSRKLIPDCGYMRSWASKHSDIWSYCSKYCSELIRDGDVLNRIHEDPRRLDTRHDPRYPVVPKSWPEFYRFALIHPDNIVSLHRWSENWLVQTLSRPAMSIMHLIIGRDSYCATSLKVHRRVVEPQWLLTWPASYNHEHTLSCSETQILGCRRYCQRDIHSFWAH